MRWNVAWVGLFALHFSLACSEKPVARKVATPKPPPAAPAPPPPPPPPEPPPEPPRVLSEADARALVDSWLSAQNQGDFHAYQSLYAQNFQGIKRVGKRTEPFDRVGWMADRGWMFEVPANGKAMHVEITDVEAEVTETSATIRFIQSFSRGKFADKGPKQIELVIEGREIRIGREEMLSSKVLRSARRAKGRARPKGDNSWTFVGGGKNADAVGGWGPPSEYLGPRKGGSATEGTSTDNGVSPDEAPSNSDNSAGDAIQ